MKQLFSQRFNLDVYDRKLKRNLWRLGVCSFGTFRFAILTPKFDWAIKKSNFNFVVEYPTWVSIKRYLTGKLALACQIWIYCIRLKENVQKHQKIAVF